MLTPFHFSFLGINEIQQVSKSCRQAMPRQDPIPPEAAAGQHSSCCTWRRSTTRRRRKQTVQTSATAKQVERSGPVGADQL